MSGGLGQRASTLAASNAELEPQRLAQATNDNSHKPVNSSPKHSLAAAVAAAHLRHHQSIASGVPIGAARQQTARPLRPNLRRQVMVATSESLAPCAPIELAGVLPVRSGGQLGVAVAGPAAPPKRPAHLPARYEAAAAAAVAQQAGAGVAPDVSKPNRYSWAQVQQWQQAQAAAGHDHPHHFSSPFSSAASRVLVVNPMQIVNLSEHTKSRLIKFIEALKRFSEKWFSHVLLLLFLAVYACFGAYIFISFEAPSEQWEKLLIVETRARIVNESWYEATGSGKKREEFIELFRQKFEDYERLLNKACASGMTSSSLENQWTFWGALFYSMTVFTTIGYGHLTPITFAGRVATMVYAIFGIPILLMVLADLGKLLTRIIKYAFKKFRSTSNKLLRRKRALKTRKLISDNTNQYMGVARDAIERGFATYIQEPCERRMPQALRSAANGFSLRRGQQKQQLEEAAAGVEPNCDKLNSADTLSPVESVGTRKASVSTDVIVTPARQTKPVSPQPGCERRLPGGDQQTHQAGGQTHGHAHHGHGHAHQQHRAHSPGPNKRKCSTSSGPSGTASRRAAQHHHHQQQQAAKSSVSRSSSSSLVGAASEQAKPTHQSPKLVDEEAGAEQKQPAAASAEDVGQAAVKGDHEALFEGGNLEEGAEQAEEEFEECDEDEEEFDIPVSFALFLLVTYMMFGAVVFSIWEGWNFFDSLYFVFISMSTIGFGDLVPQHPKRMIGTFIYLLFGLALTSMCINVVQEKIHATFLRAKMQIGEKMGLDLEQIMADDYYHDETDSMLGCDPDGCCALNDDGSTSVAISQSNSFGAHADSCALDSAAAHPTDQVAAIGAESAGLRQPGSLDCAHSHPNETAGGVKQSKSRDSLKSTQKKRSVTGLPGHNSSGSSLRRKPSQKKMGRQLTPSSQGGATGAPLHQVAVAMQQQQQQQQQQPIPKAEIAVRRNEHLVVAKDMPSINQPVGLGEKALCEPLRKPKLGQATSQTGLAQRELAPTLIGCERQHSAIIKSLSSDSRHVDSAGNPRRDTQLGAGSGRRSAGSSRRSSVSQELNQLDDLIAALSQSPANEKFGPLLGIPSSRRSSRSNSPSGTMLLTNSSPSPATGGANSRRGTSMTLRPTYQKAHLPSNMANNSVRNKCSLGIMGGSVGSAPRGATPNASRANSRSASNSSQAALEELEARKYSAV